MPLGYTNRGTKYHASNATLTSDAFTPAAGALLLVMSEELNQNTGVTLTVAAPGGWSVTWTYYKVQTSNGFEYHTTQIAVGFVTGTPSSGSLTVTRSGGGSTYGQFSEFVELSGADTNAPVRQSKTNTSTGASMALNLDSAPLASSYNFATILEGNNDPTTPSGMTGLGSQSITGGAFYGEHAYDTSPAQNNTWTNLGNFFANGVIVEIAEAQGHPAAKRYGGHPFAAGRNVGSTVRRF